MRYKSSNLESVSVNPNQGDRGFYLQVGIGVAGIALSATYLVAEPIVQAHERQQEVARQAEIDQACGADPWRGSKMRPEENTQLPPLEARPTTSYGELPQTTELGYLQVMSNDIIGGSTELKLPTEHKAAFANAFLDPYVACTTQDVIGKVFINTTTAGDKAESNSDTRNTHLYFSSTGQQEERVFATVGSVRAVMIHENTHGVLAKWSQDPKNGADLAELTRIYRAEYNEVSEIFRNEHGRALVHHLQDLKKEYTANGQGQAVEAAEYVIQQFSRPYGLNDLNFLGTSESEKAWQMNAKTILEMLAAAPTSSGKLGEKILEVHKNINTSGLKEAAKLQHEFYEAAYPDSDEDDTLGILSPSGGHPFDNPDERLASAITSSQLNPDKVLAEIEKMPERRKDLAKQFYFQALRLYQDNNADLLDWMELPKLIAKISSN